MENSERPATPTEARALLENAESARAHLASSLLLPSYFYSSIGAAIALQICTGAAGIRAQTTWGLAVLGCGVLVYVLAAGIQLARFRRLNGAWVGGLASQVLLGTAGLASITYTAAFALATWAAFAGAWWLTAIAALAGGAAYAWAGRHWWRRFQHTPAEYSHGARAMVLAAVVVLALTGLALLVALR